MSCGILHRILQLKMFRKFWIWWLLPDRNFRNSFEPASRGWGRAFQPRRIGAWGDTLRSWRYCYSSSSRKAFQLYNDDRTINTTDCYRSGSLEEIDAEALAAALFAARELNSGECFNIDIALATAMEVIQLQEAPLNFPMMTERIRATGLVTNGGRVKCWSNCLHWIPL